MQLWIEWWKVVICLRPACSRTRSFLWLVVALVGFSVRSDLLGVTSVVRGVGLKARYYDRLIRFFHSTAVNPDRLAKLWVKIVFRVFPSALRFNGRVVLLGDGIKISKSGRKMPAVKCLHQESDSNTKPEYIMGHSCQAISLAVGADNSVFAVPLTSRIHEGVVFSNRDERTQLNKMVSTLEMLGIPEPFYFIADSYYASKVIALDLFRQNAHLVSRVRNNAVAFQPVNPSKKSSRPGRPTFYGKKIPLRSFFDHPEQMTSVASPVYGEVGVTLQYRCVDLIWRPLRRLVRFVIVIHSTRGKCIFISTDLTLTPTDIIYLYGIRFKIELAFKQALRVVGAYGYHFWMRAMTPINRYSGDQYFHHKTKSYRNDVRKKIAAYHRYIQVGLIAQGLLQYLSAQFPALVWKQFGSWLRTIREGIPPSELVTAQALRASLPEFITGSHEASAFTKFVLDRIDLMRSEGLRLAG